MGIQINKWERELKNLNLKDRKWDRSGGDEVTEKNIRQNVIGRERNETKK